jgi:hypothetical protein
MSTNNQIDRAKKAKLLQRLCDDAASLAETTTQTKWFEILEGRYLGKEGITKEAINNAWIGASKTIKARREEVRKARQEKQERQGRARNRYVDGEITRHIFYDSFKRAYVTRNERGVFLSLQSNQIMRRLKMSGLSSSKNELGISEVDEALNDIEENNDVGYAGPLAGYSEGVKEIGHVRLLITQGRHIPHDEKGEWPIISQVFSTLFGEEQLDYFYSWLHFAVRALDAETHAPGQAIAIAGKRGCGKSLCQQLITVVLGGRCARPYQYMVGDTSFNADLFGAEHLMVEDEANTTDIRSRKTFGSFIKNVVANKDQRLHGKGKDAVMLQPLWRISITTNDDPEALMVLPPLEDGLEDKITLFKANMADLPMPASSPEQKAEFWNAMMREMPAFMHFLRYEWGVPEEIEDPRYGVKHYHNPVILRALHALTPEMHMLMLIEAHLIKEGLFWEGTATELTSDLTSHDCPAAFEARKLFRWATAAGTYLGRLHKMRPEQVQKYRNNGERRWRVFAEKNVQNQEEMV